MPPSPQNDAHTHTRLSLKGKGQLDVALKLHRTQVGKHCGVHSKGKSCLNIHNGHSQRYTLLVNNNEGTCHLKHAAIKEDITASLGLLKVH